MTQLPHTWIHWRSTTSNYCNYCLTSCYMKSWTHRRRWFGCCWADRFVIEILYLWASVVFCQNGKDRKNVEFSKEHSCLFGSFNFGSSGWGFETWFTHLKWQRWITEMEFTVYYNLGIIFVALAIIAGFVVYKHGRSKLSQTVSLLMFATDSLINN